MIRGSFVASLLLLACGRHDQPAPSPAPPASAPAGSSTTARPAPPPPPTAGGSAADISRPCSKISAAEVSDIVGFTVTAHDEQYRCKFVDPKDGWLQVELIDWASRSAHDI